MNILFTVEFYEPHKGGAEEVVKQLAERLVERGYAVTVATTSLVERVSTTLNGVHIEEFSLSGNETRGVHGDSTEIERYKKFILGGHFDMMINYAAQIWTTDLAFDVLDAFNGKKILVPCGYSGLHDSLYVDYFKKLPEVLKKYDRLVYLSCCYQDRIFGKEHELENKEVEIPNGAAVEEFIGGAIDDVKKKLGITTKYLLITVANHYRDKGHQFVIEAFLKMKRDDATLLIVGNNPGSSFLGKAKQFLKGCHKTCLMQSVMHSNIVLMSGSNRNEVVSVYKQADLFLFGSKIECAPLVLYESFASKTSFISTNVGNVGDYADYVKLITTPAKMALKANELLDDGIVRNNLAQRAFTLWHEKYTWDIIVDMYEKLIKSK